MVLAMATELTVKERAFAQLIIEGTKTAAYRKVYSSRGNATTQATNAYKFSKKPKIKAEVARLLRQREFPADDYARIRDLAVAGLTEIFLQEQDPRLRAKVGSVLLAYADAGLKLHPVPSEKERKYDELSQLVSEVVGRHQATVSPGTQQPIAETTQTEAPFLELETDSDASSSGDAPDGVDPESLWAQQEDGADEIEVPADGASESSQPGGNYEVIAIPGAFPPRYRKVPRLT
jgi:hypothetical protein